MLSGVGVGAGTGLDEMRVLEAGPAGGLCSEMAAQRALSAEFAVASDNGEPNASAGARLCHSGLPRTTDTGVGGVGGVGGDAEPMGVAAGDVVSKNEMERWTGSAAANLSARALGRTFGVRGSRFPGWVEIDSSSVMSVTGSVGTGRCSHSGRASADLPEPFAELLACSGGLEMQRNGQPALRTKRQAPPTAVQRERRIFPRVPCVGGGERCRCG